MKRRQAKKDQTRRASFQASFCLASGVDERYLPGRVSFPSPIRAGVNLISACWGSHQLVNLSIFENREHVQVDGVCPKFVIKLRT
ncbi:MAG: hypothetical protein ACLQBA_14750, partial [Candidatus Binataceae bacterium]